MKIGDKCSYKMRTIGPSLQSLVFSLFFCAFSVSSQVKRSVNELGRTVRNADITEVLADVFIVNSRDRPVWWCQALSCLASSKVRCGPHLLWDVCRSYLTSFSSFVKVSIFLCSCIIDIEYLVPISIQILLFCLEISEKLGLCINTS